jgi:hypothetical protein
MLREFYGATVEAQRSINKLLSFPATGREQDWEFEFADPNRIEDMLNVAATVKLDHDERCALLLILIASIDEAFGSNSPQRDLIERSKIALRTNVRVQEAMEFYWVKQGRASNKQTLEELFGK